MENVIYTVYALKSSVDPRIYVGFTKDMHGRLLEHNSGKTKATKAYLPWVLIFTEECYDRLEARKREKYWKGGSGKEHLKKLL